MSKYHNVHNYSFKKKVKYFYYNLKYKVSRFLEKYSPIYWNSLNVFKCFREYWKVRKYFEAPCIKRYYYPYIKQHEYNTDVYSKCKWRILEIKVYPLLWKWKWNQVRHEYNPTFSIMLFNKWKWRYELHSPDAKEDLIYWESILNFLYDDTCKSNLNKTYSENIWWSDYDNETKEYTKQNTVYPYLRPGYQEYLIHTFDEKQLENFKKFVIK